MTDPGAPAPPSDPYAPCEAQVRSGDRTAWLASLFAPAERRPALHALQAFAQDVRGVRGKVREPLAGELRLQWWTDAIEGETRGDVRGHPIASALLEVIRRYGLSRSDLVGFITAERDDLYDGGLATLAAFDERADQTEAALMGQAALILTGSAEGVTADAVRHAGRAVAVVKAIQALGSSRPQMLVPLDLLRLQGIGTAELKVGRNTPAVTEAIDALRRHAEDELASLRALQPRVESAAGPALLPASLAAALLRRAARRGFDPFASRLDLPQWRAQWILWRAAGWRGVV